MYTSIPYEEGWTAYVDGQQVEITPIANNALVSIDLKAGEHTVTFKYSPKGFTVGLILCILGIIAFVAVILFERFYMIKKNNRTLLQPITKADDIILEEPDDDIAPEKPRANKPKASKKKK